MALSLQKFREIVFQLLYSRNFKGEPEELSLAMRRNSVPKKIVKAAFEKAQTIWQMKEEIDEWIGKQSSQYELDRISFSEKTALRLGIYELLYEEIPPKVAISEAVRLTRKFATVEGSTFVNALLDGIYKEHEPSLSEKQIS